MVFRRDESSIKCLQWWREQCIKWCRHEYEDGKCGDQGYLNDWPERFSGVIVSAHPGIHAGPWNVGKYKLGLDSKGDLLLNDKQLICYHFHALNMINSRIALVLEGHTLCPNRFVIIFTNRISTLSEIL